MAKTSINGPFSLAALAMLVYQRVCIYIHLQPGQCNHQRFSFFLAWNVFGFGIWGISY